jgi:drug/metabolite transporter (DMT)-like permease
MTQLPSQLARIEQKSRFSITSVDLAMLAVALIWGVNFAIVKQTLTEMSPMVFISVRFLLAALVLLVVLKISGENLRIESRDIFAIVLLSLIGHVVYLTLFIQGMALTTASNAALLAATTPIFVVLISVMLRLERVNLAVGLGIVLSFIGIILIVGLGSSGISVNAQMLPGNLLMLGSAICWALNTIMSKPLLRSYSPLKLTTVTMMISTPLLFLLSAGELSQQQWSDISPRGWLGLCYSFLLANAVAYVLWNVSVQKAGNARTAVFSNLVPVVAVITSWLILGEALGLWQGIGAVVTLVGVTLTRIRPRRAPARLPIATTISR